MSALSGNSISSSNVSQQKDDNQESLSQYTSINTEISSHPSNGQNIAFNEQNNNNTGLQSANIINNSSSIGKFIDIIIYSTC